MKREKHNLIGTKAFRKGSYSTVIMVVIIAIVIAANVMFSKLPTAARNIDVSSNNLYSIGDTTHSVLDGLKNDVEIVVIKDKESTDKRISTLLAKYADYSDHIKVTYKDPVLYPSVLTTYDTEENNIVIKCDATDKTTKVAFSDIIVTSTSYYGSTYETSFDGEGQLTKAIDYVSNENNKLIYTISGHGESDLGKNISGLISKSNFNVKSVNLLVDNGIPDDCDMLICNQPTKDLADDELKLLREYMENGGKMTVVLADTTTETPNFDALMADYGISKVNGYIADTERYYGQNVYQIFPNYSSGDITGKFGSEEYTLLFGSLGLKVEETDGVTVDEFLTTSDKGAAVVGENDYTEGKYTLAAAATKDESRFTVFGSASIIDDEFTSYYTNLMDLQVFMNSITANFDDVSNISIDSISLQTTYNTIANGSGIGAIFIGIIPVALLILGFLRWFGRRKL
ncbi:MAG TPA: GldG family protein [Lachnospiraceae bacterium]|nr:GldG family protein [Lachnospiraceae bacterium]